MSWFVKFYKTSREELPVQEFVETLDESTYGKYINAVRMLKEYGPFLKPPISKKISSHIYELRITGEINVRIFYTIINNDFYLLHGFKKQSQKTPPKEIKKAIDRYKEII
ncbi:MAG: type II toxin-antitoxin system RelE/ParE family toxin [candidate division WWE3 bacterium]|nr:type II toxin-antitoxin system RelE/ParE family toxin [candidate division WWE3 bacterium]